MSELIIQLPEQKSRSYSIHIGNGFTESWFNFFKENQFSKIFIITEEKLISQVLTPLEEALKVIPVPIHTILRPSGESAKHISQLELIFDNLIQAGADRSSCLIAAGGGVVGDLAGFVAATLLRGIAFIQLPSTLLSMVDSSVGGKVAVNVNTGKNMVGAFYQPKMVYSNLDYLKSLPQQEWICGLAEMVKHSFLTENELIYTNLVKSAKSLQQNENKSAPFSSLEPKELAARIQESISVKATIVGQDETEQGLRATLNLGHTTAHAIESLQHYTGMSHGEAVSRGLVTALYLSKEIGLPDQEFQSMIELMQMVGLPLDTAGFEADQLFEHTKFDKKNKAGQTRFVLLKKRGEVVWGQPITFSQFNQAWSKQKSRFG